MNTPKRNLIWLNIAESIHSNPAEYTRAKKLEVAHELNKECSPGITELIMLGFVVRSRRSVILHAIANILEEELYKKYRVLK